jgi:hypothetical protein
VVRRSPAAAQCYTARRTRPPHRQQRCATTPTCDSRQAAHAHSVPTAPGAPDHTSEDHIRSFDDAHGRAPNRVPAVLTPPMAIAGAHDDHRRHALTVLRVSSWHAIASGARNTTDQPREEKSTRRRYNVAAHLRHARVTIPPSARGARERGLVPSGAAACYAAPRFYSG